MSYDIYIGQAEVESSWDENDQPSAEWVVNQIFLPEAPFKPDMTQHSNGCHPGYSQWADFARSAGLHEFFFDEFSGVMRHHPGCERLTPEHLITVQRAASAYREARPTLAPGLCRCKECDRLGGLEGLAHDPSLDFNLLRLEWLEWWIRWAINNCSWAAIYNR